MSVSRTIYFDPSFDGLFWNGCSKATVGTVFVGPLRFIDLLETHLGLSAQWATAIERVNDLVEKLQTIPEKDQGFWKNSFSVDAIGVARELLCWRDELMLSGWDGRAEKERLKTLWQTTHDALPGIPDRLMRIIDFLDNSTTSALAMDKVFLVEPANDLPHLWQKVLSSLKAKGVAVDSWSHELAETTGNLRLLCSQNFSPNDTDDSVIFLEPETFWEAAEHVAAWLVNSIGDDIETVIIGATPELDSALAKYGLPTSGAEMTGPAAVEISNLLWLIIALGEEVPDPSRVLEFLLLQEQPLPKHLSRELARSLHEFPGIGNEKWQEIIGHCTVNQDKDDNNKAKSNQILVEHLFAGDLKDHYTFPRNELINRYESILLPWLQRKLRAPQPGPRIGVFNNSVKLIVNLLRAQSEDNVSAFQLKKMISGIADKTGRSLYSSEAGLHFVEEPQAMLETADRVVWWDFSMDTAPIVKRLPLSEAEYAELESQGCVPRQHWERLAQAQSVRWWRPLELCREQIVFATPKQSVGGDANSPHPLYSELEAKLPEGMSLPIRADAIQPDCKNRTIAPTPRQPRRDWATPVGVGPRDGAESPSGIGTMLQCPFKWVMKYHAKLYEPLARSLADGGLLDGKLFHEIFNQLCLDMPKDPSDARQKAGELFDQMGPTLCAPLFLSGAEHDRQKFRKKLMENVERFTAEIAALGAKLEASEVSFSGKIGQLPLKGRLDVVLSSPATIIDFKNSEGSRKMDLAEGVAVQLIAYAQLLKESKGIDAAVAYFILNSRSFLYDETGRNGSVGWEALEETYLEHLEELKKTITAAGIPNQTEEVVAKNKRSDDDKILLKPECKYCIFDVLCGRNEIKGEK